MRSQRSLIVAVILVGLLGCGRKPPAPSDPTGPTHVSVGTPKRKAIRYTVEQPGRIDPFEETPIYARISGYVERVCVEIGERVKRGQLLAKLNVPELVAEHKRKEGLVAQARLDITRAEQAEQLAEASLASARARVAVAKAALGKASAALERWQSEYKRFERLVKQGVVDQQSRDEARNQFRSAEAGKRESAARITAAEAELAEARTQREKASTDLSAARNHLLVAQAGEQQAKAMLDYSHIRSPFDGVISDRQVHTGHFLQGATGPKGKPLFVVVRMDRVRVFVEVPEMDAVRVRQGNTGQIKVQALNDREFVGKVAGTSWSLDPSQRTLRTEIDFDNSEGVLRPGMYVHARITLEHPGAWVIPAGAVLVRDGESFCYQVRKGRAHRLVLRPGLRDGPFVEVLKFQAPPSTPGERPRWINPDGGEQIVLSKVGDLLDNQEIEAGKSAD